MHPLPSVRRAAELAASLALVAACAGVAQSQTVGGQVVQLDSKKPLGGAAVALVNDSARVVASTAASNDGEFFLDAPGAGGYRVVLFVSGASFVSPSLQLDSGKTVQRQFSVPDVPETFTSTLFARDVTTPATPFPGSPIPKYPEARLAKGERALVSTMFVVGANGQPDMATFRTLSTTDADFVLSVRDALHRTRFVPAEKDGATVPQVVQLTYDFGLPNDPERGDVIIRPKGSTPRVPETVVASKASQGKYVISGPELAQAEIAPLSVMEAMHRLRPAIFSESGRTPADIGTGTNCSNSAVYVDGNLVDASRLRELRAGQVLDLRYWPREEASMKFGMGYCFGVTLKLRTP
jgi:hypothetical protein